MYCMYSSPYSKNNMYLRSISYETTEYGALKRDVLAIDSIDSIDSIDWLCGRILDSYWLSSSVVRPLKTQELIRLK